MKAAQGSTIAIWIIFSACTHALIMLPSPPWAESPEDAPPVLPRCFLSGMGRWKGTIVVIHG